MEEPPTTGARRFYHTPCPFSRRRLLGASLVYIIKQVSDYYVSKYHFSLWAGVLLFSIAFIFLALICGATQKITIDCLCIAAVGLILFTLIQDIRLSNVGMGLLAFLLQFLLTISLFSIIFVFAARWIMNRLLGKRAGFVANPGLAIGLNRGEPFRCFFTLNFSKRC